MSEWCFHLRVVRNVRNVSLLYLILNLCRDSCASSCLQRAHGERFSTNTNCSHAVIQNPNCTLLDVDDTVGQSNVDWLTGGLENGKEVTAGFTENGRNTKKNHQGFKKQKYSKKSADSGYSRYLSLFLILGLTKALCYECYSLFILLHSWLTDRLD